MTTSHSSICRVCQNQCAVQVEVEHGRVVAVHGDRENPIYRGYTCIKGRNHPAFYGHPDRLLQCLKRNPSGQLAPIPTEEAIGEIAERLERIVDQHGPRAVAMFWGSYFALENAVSLSMADAFMRALDSPMVFSPATIDQPGKVLAKGLHGMWMAGGQAVLDPEVVLMVGNNPLVSHQGINGHPGHQLKELRRRGGSLIVIDPRRTETAMKATHYLQPRPGEDAAILAGILRVIIEEELYDADFVADNVDGFDALRRVAAPFTPAHVADRAGIEAEALIEVARIFGRARRGYAVAGTGPNMTGHGTLVEYLLLCLDTMCGHWLREGEPVKNALSMVPAVMQMPTAQAFPPFPSFGFGEPLRVRGLTNTLAGMPTAALADEILLPGEGQVRALLSLGGNPATCVPDGQKVAAAFKSLDLLVQVDVQMSTTASLADYVIPSRLAFEMPSTNLMVDFFSLYANGWGLPESFAQYTPALVEPPDGSEVIEPSRFLYRLAQRMHLELELFPGAGALTVGTSPTTLKMDDEYDADTLLEIIHSGSRIPLEEVKRHPKGALFPDPAVVVQPKMPDWPGRLDVGNATMMEDLSPFAQEPRDEEGEFPFRLTVRRTMHVFNTPTIAMPEGRRPHNPAFLHPDDMAALGASSGDVVELASERDTISAVLEPDPSVRPGTVSMSHSFGGVPGNEDDVRKVGSNPGRLVADDIAFDRYSGQPRMSNVPVGVRVLGDSVRDDAGNVPQALLVND